MKDEEAENYLLSLIRQWEDIAIESEEQVLIKKYKELFCFRR